jgi:ribonucleoside-diphosphate reductase alpha chain
VLGKGEHEGKAPETNSVVSRGLLRSKTDRLMVVQGGGATALRSEPEILQEAEAASALSTLGWTEPTRTVEGMAERRAEARMKGYVGEACPECANFTLVRNGTCLKCETCGSTTGCS